MATKEGSIYEEHETGQEPYGYTDPASDKARLDREEKARKLSGPGSSISYEQALKALESKVEQDTLGYEAAKSRAGRRAMFAEGGERTIRAAEQLAEDVEASGQVGVSKALAVAPGTDIRSLSGLATEAQVGADVAGGAARKEAAVSMMDVAKAVEEMGSEAEDYAAKKAELDAGMNEIIAKNKGKLDDDEEAIATEIRAMVNKDPTIPPDLRSYYLQKANDILSGKWEV